MAEAFRIAGSIQVDSGQATKGLGDFTRAADTIAKSAQHMSVVLEASLKRLDIIAMKMLAAGGAAKVTVPNLQSFVAAGDSIAKSADRMAASLEKSTRTVEKSGKAAKEAGMDFGKMVQALAANQLLQQVSDLAKGMLSATSRMQAFRGTLQAVTGSIDEANRYLKLFSDFANTTPFDLPEVVQAGVKFKAMGLEIERNLKLAGTLAATFGTDLTTAVDAVGKTLTGSAEGVEMLRNRFAFSRQEMIKWGVVLDKQGQVILRGTNDIKAMQKALEAFADEKGGDALAIRAKGLEAAWSNLTGKVFELAAAIGDELAPALLEILHYGEGVVDWMKTWDPATKAVTGGVILLAGAVGTLATALAPLVISVAGLSKLFAASAAPAAAAAAGTEAVGVAAAGATASVTALGLATAFLTVGGIAAGLYVIYQNMKLLADETKRSADMMDLLETQAIEAAPAVKAVTDARGRGPGETPAAPTINQAATGLSSGIEAAIQSGDLEGAVAQFKQLEEAAKQAKDKLKDPSKLSEQEQKQAAQVLQTFAETGKNLLAVLEEKGSPLAKPLFGYRPVGLRAQELIPEVKKSIGAEGSLADSVMAIGQKLYAAAGMKQVEKTGPAAAPPARPQRTIQAIQNDLEEVDHLEKIGKLEADAAAERRKNILEELRQNDDRVNARSLLYKLEEAGYKNEQRRHGLRMDAIKQEKSMLEARGQLTPEAEKRIIGKERKEIQAARGSGLITADEAKKELAARDVEEAKAEERRLARARENAVHMKTITQGEVAGKIEALKGMEIELRKQGVSEVDIAKRVAMEKAKIYSDDAQAKIDAEERVAKRRQQIAQRSQDRGITKLEDRLERGEDVATELAGARTQRAKTEATGIRRQGRAEVRKLREQLKGMAPNDPRRAQVEADINSILADSESEAKDTEASAARENEKQAREEAERRRQERGRSLEIQRSGLGIQQGRLEQAVAAGAPGAGQALLTNIQKQYDLQQKILDVEKERAMVNATAAEKANLEAEYAQKSYKAKMDAVDALTKANDLIAKQKEDEKIDRAKQGGGFDFTTGNVIAGKDVGDTLAQAFGNTASEGPDSGSYAAYLEKRKADRAAEAQKKFRARFGLPGPNSFRSSPWESGLPSGGTPPFMPTDTRPTLTGLDAGPGSAMRAQINAGWRASHARPPEGGYSKNASADIHVYVHEADGTVQQSSASVPLGPPGSEAPGNPQVPMGRL